MFVENAMTDPLLRIVVIIFVIQIAVGAAAALYSYFDQLSEVVPAAKFFFGGWLIICFVYLAFHWIATSEHGCSGGPESSLLCFFLTLPVQGMIWMDRTLFSVPVVGTIYGSA